MKTKVIDNISENQGRFSFLDSGNILGLKELKNKIEKIKHANTRKNKNSEDGCNHWGWGDGGSCNHWGFGN